jgi:hypothetical protein
MHDFFSFSGGDPFASKILKLIFECGCLIGLFALVIRAFVLHLVPNTSSGNRLLGICIGSLFGMLMGHWYAQVYRGMFGASPTHVTVATVAGMILNFVIVTHMYKSPDSGGTP